MCRIDCSRPICAVLLLIIVIDKDVSCRFINGRNRNSNSKNNDLIRFDVQKDMRQSGLKHMYINEGGETPMFISTDVQGRLAVESNRIESDNQYYENEEIPDFDRHRHEPEDMTSPPIIEEPAPFEKYNSQINLFIDKGPPPDFPPNEDRDRDAHTLIDDYELSPFKTAFLQSKIQPKKLSPRMGNTKELEKPSLTLDDNNLEDDEFFVSPYSSKPWPRSFRWTYKYGKRTPRISELNDKTSLFLVDPHIIPLAIRTSVNRVARQVNPYVQSCWKVVGNDVYFCKSCPNECVKDTPTYLLKERNF